jgi:hypothetical protein
MGADIFMNIDTVKEDLNADKSKKWSVCNFTLMK